MKCKYKVLAIFDGFKGFAHKGYKTIAEAERIRAHLFECLRPPIEIKIIQYL